MTFKELYDNVMERINPVDPNKLVSTGSCMAIIESTSGNIYYGVNMDTACDLGMCAERAAIASMVTCGEFEIARLVVVHEDGALRLPCGACREVMLQLSPVNANTEILTNVEEQKFVRLSKLMPLWWGVDRY